MERVPLFLQMLDALTLPAAIILAAWMIRGGLRALGSDLWRGKQTEQVTDFQRTVHHLGKKAESCLAEEGEIDSAIAERLRVLAGDSLRSAILEGWQMVEEAARKAARECQPSPGGKDPEKIRTGDLLLLGNRLTPTQYEVFNALRQLRNTALNLENLETCKAEIEDYIRITALLVRRIASGKAAVPATLTELGATPRSNP